MTRSGIIITKIVLQITILFQGEVMLIQGSSCVRFLFPSEKGFICSASGTHFQKRDKNQF